MDDKSNGNIDRQDPALGAGRVTGWEGAASVNRQWAEFLQNLSFIAYSQPDPLLKHATRFHPRFHMHLPDEDDRLSLLQSQCLRLCGGDQARARRLAADVIWGSPA